MATMRFDERDLLRQTLVTVRVVRRPMHRLAFVVGLWLVRVGFRLTGAGIVVEDAF